MNKPLWVKLECDYLDNPKILAVSESAELLYLRMLTVAKRLLTDGLVARGHVSRYGVDGWQDAVDELVEVGLWVPHGGPSGGPDGWQIVGWQERHETAKTVDARRREGRANALKRWHKAGNHDASAHPECPACMGFVGDPLGDPVGGSDGVPSDPPMQETEVEKEPLVATDVADEEEPGPDVSDDARRLTRRFAKKVQANGFALPSKGTKAHETWLVEMDRLLRIGPPGDGGHVPDPAEVEHVIDWATSDEFWAANCRSVKKLREKWPQLRLKSGAATVAASSGFMGGVRVDA